MKMIYNIIRNKIAKTLAGNNGKCEIQEDKIICYVNKNKLKKECQGPRVYNLIYNGVEIPYEKYHKTGKILSRYERLAKKYDLDKPIYYVIENVAFDKRINFLITSENNSIVFKKCTFYGQIYINYMDKLIFINNKYIAYEESENVDPFIPSNEFTIRNIDCINELIFIDDNLIIPNGTLKLHLNAKNIHMLRTKIKNASELNITADNLNMEYSDITAEIANISSPNITLMESTITSDRALIETEEETLKNIQSKCTIIKKEVLSESENKSKSRKRALKRKKL